MSQSLSKENYKKATGLNSVNDDLERANCPRAGELGHYSCGWSHAWDLPYQYIIRKDDYDIFHGVHRLRVSED